MKQPTLFDLEAFTKSSFPTPVYDPAWDELETASLDIPCVGGQTLESDNACKSVGGQVAIDTLQSAHQHDTHWIERYWVERSGNKYWYYRYCWRVGRKKNRCYIGSVNSIIAKRKKADVEIAIRDEQSPQEIEKLIRFWCERVRSHS